MLILLAILLVGAIVADEFILELPGVCIRIQNQGEEASWPGMLGSLGIDLDETNGGRTIHRDR